MFNIKNNFIIYDFETEGLNHAFSKPWDIAWCVYQNGKLQKEIQYFLDWPNLNVSYGAAKETGFRKETIKKSGVDPMKVIKEFDQYIYDPNFYIIGHNILGYDSQIHNVARRELGLKTDFSYIHRVIDTNAIARGIKLERLPKEHENFTAWQYRILDVKAKGVKTKIPILCKEFHIPYEEEKLHSALYDVKKNFEILKKLIELIDIKV